MVILRKLLYSYYELVRLSFILESMIGFLEAHITSSLVIVSCMFLHVVLGVCVNTKRNAKSQYYPQENPSF